MQNWPIFIISLADAQARRKPLEAMLSYISLRYEIIDAVDARTGVPRHLSDLIDQSRARAVLGRELSAPEVGCALSHLFLYKKIVGEGLPGAVIFEDDAILSEGDKFRQFMDERVYERYNLIQLGYGAARIWGCGIGQRRETRMLRSERLVHNAGLATAYSISFQGAEFILERAIPVRCVADWPCDLRPIAPRILIPKLVGSMPQGVKSNLEQDRLQKKKLGKGRGADGGGSKTRAVQVEERRNPPPPGYWYFHRFLSRTVF